jgi:hypothetical protein
MADGLCAAAGGLSTAGDEVCAAVDKLCAASNGDPSASGIATFSTPVKHPALNSFVIL